jgi:hypothetical protein
MTLQEREELFKAEVIDTSSAIYCDRLIVEFIEYWSEQNKPKSKMRFELEKTWDLSKRLARFARNSKYDPYFKSGQNSIKQKKQELIKYLEPYMKKYGRDTLNSFYRWWSQPENVPNPKNLKWENESHWELGNRLESWRENNEKIEAKQKWKKT